MIDFAELRRAMVDAQVRANDVTDLRIVAAMMEIPRERFVPTGLRNFAYIDDDLLVKDGAAPRYLMEPMVLAKMVQAADIPADGLVLDVGAATGYSSAILSRLSGQVVALEEDAELAANASAVSTELGLPNVAVVQGPLGAGWASEAPYDVVFVNGSVDVVPEALFAQVKEGGRLVAVVGRGRSGRATVFTKTLGAMSSRIAFDAGVPLLPGFAAPAGFVF